jgi:hypothetical protein
MRLQSFRVAQVLKAGPKNEVQSEVGALPAGVLFLDSCQRYLWVFSDAQNVELELPPFAQFYEGIEAYRFLLRVATGLESQILGETDIFGQLKTAWKNSAAIDDGVSFWLQKIFEDTKEIRARHLEKVGGASYGSLVRKHFEGRLDGVTLLVGAGALGASVAPYLLESDELILVNRSFEKAVALKNSLNSDSVTVIAKENARDAWLRADRVIVCIPGEPFDPHAIGARQVLHLGCLRADAGEWKSLGNIAFLDDFFLLQKTLNDTRSIQIAAAERDCDERAKLRGLSASVSVSHGWEDLAVFA